MKQWTLIRSFYSHMKGPSIMMALMMTISLFILTIGVGRYRYFTYAQEQLLRSGLDNAHYITHFGSDKPDEDEIQDEIKIIKQKAGVKSILYTCSVNPLVYNDEGFSLVLYPSETLHALPLGMQPDAVFSGTGLDEDGGIQAVAASTVFSNASVGDRLIIDNGSKNASFPIRITGKLPYPFFTASFNSAGDIGADAFISTTPLLIAKDTPETRKVLETVPGLFYYTSTNYFLEFSDDTAPEQRSALLEELGQDHYILSYDELVVSTEKTVQKNLPLCLPVPLFLLFIATMCLLSTSLLMVEKKANENAVWFLCGCSKRRCFLTMFVSLGLPGLLAAALNILFIVLYPILGEREILNIGQMYIDPWNILVILIYLVCVWVISLVIPYFLQYRKSPIESVRKRSE